MTTEQTIQAELDAHNVKMALENGTNTVKASYVSKVADGDRGCITCTHNNEEWDSDNCDGCCENHSNYDRAISLNEWHEQAKDVKYSANNLTTICVKPQDREPMYYPQVEGITPTVVAHDRAVSLNAVENITFEEPPYTDAINVLTWVRDKVRELPPVTPQIKGADVKEYCYRRHLAIVDRGFLYELEARANWIKGNWIETGWGDYRCDKCGDIQTEKTTFCPNCGARMVGDDNEV